jgi:trimethylamine--corrinoid protein Co-methyltransferase
LLSALAGANLIYGAGMLEAGMTFSFGQLVIDNEIAAMVKRIICGISVEDELMGVDQIFGDGTGQGNDHRSPHARSMGEKRVKKLDSVCQSKGCRTVKNPQAGTTAGRPQVGA